MARNATPVRCEEHAPPLPEARISLSGSTHPSRGRHAPPPPGAIFPSLSGPFLKNNPYFCTALHRRHRPTAHCGRREQKVIINSSFASSTFVGEKGRGGRGNEGKRGKGLLVIKLRAIICTLLHVNLSTETLPTKEFRLRNLNY